MIEGDNSEYSGLSPLVSAELHGDDPPGQLEHVPQVPLVNQVPHKHFVGANATAKELCQYLYYSGGPSLHIGAVLSDSLTLSYLAKLAA